MSLFFLNLTKSTQFCRQLKLKIINLMVNNEFSFEIPVITIIIVLFFFFVLLKHYWLEREKNYLKLLF